METNNGGTSLIQLGEVEFRGTVGGSDLSQAVSSNVGHSGGRPIASSEGTGNWIYYAFDNTTDGNSWAGSPNTDQWVGFIFPSPVKPLQAALIAPTVGVNALARSPNVTRIEGTNDGVTWTTIAGPVTLGAWTSLGQTRTINL